MQETSSKYVDQIAVEKLINEKLCQAPHQSSEPLDSIDISFENLETQAKTFEMQSISDGDTDLKLGYSSLVKTGDHVNDHGKVIAYMSQHAKGDVLFIHGLYEENVEIYKFLFSQLNDLNLNVYLLQLPYHYERTPNTSKYSGEYFLSADIPTALTAFKQAVYDAACTYAWLKKKNGHTVTVTGFSIGGCIALILAALKKLDGLFLINPVCTITEILWSSRLFSTIKQNLERQGITFKDLKNAFLPFEPTEYEQLKTSREKIILVRGLYDQINDPANYKSWKQMNPGVQEHVYKAGHLNILRVPKLSADVARLANAKKFKTVDEHKRPVRGEKAI